MELQLLGRNFSTPFPQFFVDMWDGFDALINSSRCQARKSRGGKRAYRYAAKAKLKGNASGGLLTKPPNFSCLFFIRKPPLPLRERAEGRGMEMKRIEIMSLDRPHPNPPPSRGGK